MKLATQKIITTELYEILNKYFNDKDTFDNIFKEQSKKMVNKLTIDTKKSFIQNYLLIFGVKSSDAILENLRTNSIVKIKNEKLAYIYYLCMIDINDEYSVNIVKTKYDKESFELEEFMDTIATMFLYTADTNSKSLSINKIDNILTNKRIAKNVRNSVTTRLTLRKDDNYFRCHPKTDIKIVTIEELREYLNIKDKHINIECPVCGNMINITSKNITKIIDFNKRYKTVNIICNHEHTLYLKELPFILNIDKYIDKNYKQEDVSMFVLNNYNMLVRKLRIFKKLRKISKSSKIVKLHNLKNCLDFKNKYIFIDHPFKDNYKIKLNEENLNKIFEVNKAEKKVYLNIIDDLNTTNYYKIGLIDIYHVVDNIYDDVSTDKNIALSIVHNYKLLKMKKLINKCI